MFDNSNMIKKLLFIFTAVIIILTIYTSTMVCSYAAPENGDIIDGNSDSFNIIGITIAIAAAVAVIILIIIFIPKDKNSKDKR